MGDAHITIEYASQPCVDAYLFSEEESSYHT